MNTSNKLSYILLILFLTATGYAQAQRIMPLWEAPIPNQNSSQETEQEYRGNILRIGNVQEPTLEIYLPTARNATGQGVVICPGGGYTILAYDWEGTDIAKWFNSLGIAAFVLKYRLPTSKSLITPHQAPLLDAQRAIRTVRHHASEWNIDAGKIGVMGFSAGGHLASTLATHYEPHPAPADSIDALNARPDFAILIYPVISMDTSYTHGGSRRNLLGENPDADLVRYYSNELQVTSDTPPTFLLHSSDDEAVPVMNSLLFYQALQAAKVPAEMHIYPYGGHGYSLAIGQGRLQNWTENLAAWLRGRGD
jgi:acetyl esterase/lipase